MGEKLIILRNEENTEIWFFVDKIVNMLFMDGGFQIKTIEGTVWKFFSEASRVEISEFLRNPIEVAYFTYKAVSKQ